MLVYKFGGASIETPDRMRALLPIIMESKKPLLVIVSAYGKTTNALELIVNEATCGNKEEANKLINSLEEQHNEYAASLLSVSAFEKVQPKLNELYTELQWAADETGSGNKDYIYDQIVCIGELLSTTLFHAFLAEQQLECQWLDARDIIKTDTNYRDPNVDWNQTQEQVNKIIRPALDKSSIVTTQGFIGSTLDNASVTLGREGSDYTAALLTAMLQAESLTIWKDVEGLKNADPKLFPNTVNIHEITYEEVIEMAYYGAQVIHPKTIKPLQNANIPLYVKCFLDSKLKGTIISNNTEPIYYPPLIVLKDKQVVLQIISLDFSFITEDSLSDIYDTFHDLHIKINVIQNAAISLLVCVDENDDKLNKLIPELKKKYKVFRNEDVQLLTIRYHTQAIINELTKYKNIVLEQKTWQTVQLVIK